MKDEETISDDRYYSPIWDFINNIYKDITENNNDVTLTETDLTKLIKKMIRESKFSKITSVGVAGLAATGVIMFVNDYNDVQITDKDGNSYEAETGDIFTGKIIDMEGIGKDGNTTSITIRTKDGKEVQFITYQRVYHLKPGDKLTIKVAPDTFISDRGKIQY
jgi:hypothetical protein